MTTITPSYRSKQTRRRVRQQQQHQCIRWQNRNSSNSSNSFAVKTVAATNPIKMVRPGWMFAVPVIRNRRSRNPRQRHKSNMKISWAWRRALPVATLFDKSGLAAVQHHASRTKGATGRTKQPLTELDRSVPLPDTAACVKGMQCVLKRSVDIAVDELVVLLPPSPSTEPNDDDSQQQQRQQQRKQKLKLAARKMIQQLWLSYLRAWADGAGHYGKQHAHVRFSFRDLFLSNQQAHQLLRHHLVHHQEVVAQERNDDDDDDANHDHQSTAKGQSATLCIASSKYRFGDDDEDDSNDEIDEGGDSSDDDDIDGSSSGNNNNDKNVHDGGVVKVGFRGRRLYPTKIRINAIRQVIQAHTSYRHKGYKEAALYLQPSMTMVAAFVWLALTKQNNAAIMTAGTTSNDFCYWIATGRLPLMTAFTSLLSSNLQTCLEPIANFFRMEKPPQPAELEAMATKLCVACRLLVQPIVLEEDTDDNDDDDVGLADVNATETKAIPPSSVVEKYGRQKQHVRFWSVSSLPRIIAQLVANAGLDQSVLDRTLVMAGFSLDYHPSLSTTVRRNNKKRRRSGVTQSKTADTATGDGDSDENRKKDNTEPPCDSSSLPILRQAEFFSCTEELLGLIAIACQLDPKWRTWQYSMPPATTPPQIVVPCNESQFVGLLRNGPTMNSYLDFVEQHVFPDGDRDHIDNQDNRLSMLPQEYFDAVGGSSVNEQQLYKDIMNDDETNSSSDSEDDYGGSNNETAVRPCSLLAGGQVPKGVDASSLRKRTCGTKNIHEHLAQWRKDGRPARREKKPRNSYLCRKRKDLDQPILLPLYDFWQMDKAFNEWIPSNRPDADQNRLIEFLAFSANADSDVVRQSMSRLLRRKQL